MPTAIEQPASATDEPSSLVRERARQGLTPNGQSRLWTPHENATLRDRLRAGQSYDAVARELGRTPQAVSARASRLGTAVGVLARRRESEQLRRLIAAGLPACQIVEATGLDRTTVRKRAAALGLTVARSPFFWTDADLRTLTALHTAEPLRAVAARLGRSPIAVAKKLGELGLSLDPAARGRLAGRRLAEQSAQEAAALAARYRLPAGLTPRQVQVLVTLACAGCLSYRGIARAMGMQSLKMHAGDMMADLTRRGLVVRVYGHDQRPRVLYVLSATALDLLAAAAPPEATP